MSETQANTYAQEQEFYKFHEKFKLTAIFQGRLAYFVMSIHATNPDFLGSVIAYNFKPYLFYNMIYGFSVMFYARPNMTVINSFNRLTLSVMGSLMFNYSSMLVFDWLKENYRGSKILLTIFGVLSGRFMLIHLLAYLYHVDTRSKIPGLTVQRDYIFEQMYS